MNIFKKFVIIGLMALVIGLLFNRFYAQGIKWKLLVPSSALKQAQDANLIKIISADSAFALWNKKEISFLDLRPSIYFELDHVPGAQNIPLSEIVSGKVSLRFDHSSNWVIYDEEGKIDELIVAGQEMLKKGAKRVYIIFGGYFSWLDNNCPVEAGGRQ